MKFKEIIRGFIISQYDNKCIQYVLREDGAYDQMNFYPQSDSTKYLAVMAFDPQRNRFWIQKDTEIHLVDVKGNSLLKFPYHSRTASVDKNGNIWIGGQGVTLIKSNRQRFDRYLYQENHEKERVDNSYKCRGIIEKNNTLYVGTYQSLRKVDLKTGNDSDFGGAGRKFVNYKDKQNRLWYANRIVQRYDPSDSFVTEEYSGTGIDRIWDICQDNEGKMWIGGRGISYLENGQIEKIDLYNEFPQLEQLLFLDLYKDKNGVIWVVSTNGLYILDPQKGIVSGFGKFMDGVSYLPTNKFQHIYQDAEGIYWLATEDVGLIRWNKISGDWKVFEKKDGFLSNNIYSVYEDDYGYLWMSSFKGLIQMYKQSGKVVNVFTEEDGITFNEFNRISHLQTEKGRLFFGGQNGITALDPKDFIEHDSINVAFNLNVEHISIFGTKVFQDSLHNGDPIELEKLGAGVRVIDLQLSCSDLFWANGVELHYVLKRLNDNGSEVMEVSREYVSSDNHIELFGMTPGNYTLNVRAIHKSGKQKGETLTIPVNIALPIAQTLSFKIGVFILLCFLSWGLFKYRTTQLRNRKIDWKDW